MHNDKTPHKTLAFAEKQVIQRAEYLSDKRKWYEGSNPDKYSEEDWNKVQLHHKVLEIEEITSLRYYEHLVEYIKSDYFDNCGTGWELYQKTIGKEIHEVVKEIRELETNVSCLLNGTYKAMTISDSGQKDLESGHAIASRLEDVFKYERHLTLFLEMREEMKVFIEHRETHAKGNAKIVRDWNHEKK